MDLAGLVREGTAWMTSRVVAWLVLLLGALGVFAAVSGFLGEETVHVWLFALGGLGLSLTALAQLMPIGQYRAASALRVAALAFALAVVVVGAVALISPH